MRRIFINLAALPLCLLNGCGNLSTSQKVSSAPIYPTWNKFVSKECTFSVLMPGTPKSESSAIKGKAGTAHSKTFILDARQGNDLSSYSVYYTHFPLGYLRKFDSYKFLERTWEDRFSDMKNRLVYKKRIKLNGFAAIEFQYRDKGASTSLTTTRYYLANDRTYLVTASTSKVGFARGYADKYLNSFQILE